MKFSAQKVDFSKFPIKRGRRANRNLRPDHFFLNALYKVRFQDDNTEKQIAKNHILRIHLLPEEVPVFYTNESDGTFLPACIKGYCLLENGEPGYLLKTTEQQINRRHKTEENSSDSASSNPIFKYPRAKVQTQWSKVPSSIKQQFQVPSAPVTPSRSGVDLDNLVDSTTRSRSAKRSARRKSEQMIGMSPLTPSKMNSQNKINKLDLSNKVKTPTSASKRRRGTPDGKKNSKRVSLAQENTLPSVPE